MADEQKRLTLKQERFIAAYLGEAKGNATEAARKAGYAGNTDTLKVDGARLLANANIRARIDEVLQAESMSSAEVLRELTDVAKAEWGAFVLYTTDPKTGQEIPVKMDLGGKVKALELLGKYHKMFTDKVEHGGGVTVVREYVDGD